MSTVLAGIEMRGQLLVDVPRQTVVRESRFQLVAQRQTAKAVRLADICARSEYIADACGVYRYADATVHSGNGVVALADKTVILEAWQVAKHYVPAEAHTDFSSWWAEATSTADTAVVETPVIHCLHRSTDAFGHFVMDGVAALTLVWDDLMRGDIKLLIPQFAERWIRGRLHEIGIDQQHTITASGPVRYPTLLLPSLVDTRNTFRPNPEMLDRISRLIPHPEGQKHRRIYLSRKNQKAWSRRFITNEDEVEQALARIGVEIVEPANMTFPEQARLFASADVIIGPHGSAFANLCFARPDVKVVDLMPEGWVGFWPEGTPERWLLDLTAARRQNYTIVLCESVTTGPERYSGPELTTIESTVDVGQLMTVLEAL